MPDMPAWLRDHPVLADWALALVLVAFSASKNLTVIGISAGLAATVVARRRYPVVAFWTAVALGAVQVGTELPPVMADLAIVAALHTVAFSRPRRQSVAALGGCLAVSAVAIAQWGRAYPGPLIAVIAGVAGLAVTAWVAGDSASRARALQQRRSEAVQESAARLRQIERNLHDGAQVRLTALAMMLGEAKECLDEGGAGNSDRVPDLVGAAHQAAKDALVELRDLARGIHPPVLDRGLAAALAALAEASPVAVTVTAPAAGRSSAGIEAIAYFCAAELLANAAKHSGASRVAVTVSGGGSGGGSGSGSGLTLVVADDGAGGACVVPGGGLAGLAARVRTVDGRMTVDSPAGGPTTVTIVLPEHA